MPQKYIARKRLRVGASIIEPGGTVSQAALGRKLATLLSAGAVVCTRTGFAQRYPMKAKIPGPAAAADADWRHKRGYRVHGWQFYGLGHPGPNPQ